ncbi:MAG TPA: PDZ domain-containing protein, partial [Xanthobacteraceae bacterium]|nr:PDZ domain-containing protein [Xanthobacteraceae bacterium]
RSGLLTGDRIIRLDDVAVTGADDLIRVLSGERIGREVEIEVVRNGKRRQFRLLPEERAQLPRS